MIHRTKHIATLVVLLLVVAITPLYASADEAKSSDVNVKELILDHLADAYEWHITTYKEHHVSVPLPVILYGEQGFDIFLSSKFHHGHESYKGYSIASEGKYKGKIVETNSAGEEVRPWDFSITKNALSLLMASTLIVVLILLVARFYKKQGKGNYVAPKGFVGMMEMLIVSIQDDVIKPCVGPNFAKFSPYLLTVFFFIFINNLLGLVPLFPGGANVTGNISVTVVLALFTFFIVNIFGTKEYWREIFWPDVPWWLKVPIPLMPLIEILGIFTKPFALMIRLFANIMAGHAVVLGLTCLIFVTVSLGSAINTSMSALSLILVVFISFLEILVAYIQAYVFTMLSAIFIGLAQVEPHTHKGH